MLKDFKALVSPHIFARGERYYQENRIRRYKLSLVDVGEYLIRAVISGDTDYQVEIRVDTKRDSFHYDGSCSCPYDWDEICKHQVAAMLHFLYTTFPSAPQKRYISEFEKLQNIMNEPDPHSLYLGYQVKGLLLQKMVNFSFTLTSPELSEKELDRIVAYITNPEREDDMFQTRYAARFAESSLQVIEYLRNCKTRSSKSTGTVLFPKTPGNFAFIYNLASSAEVICVETGRKVLPGPRLKPTIEIQGTEDMIQFQLSADEYELVSNKHPVDPFYWTVIDDHLHQIDMRGISELPQRVKIPDEEKGKFLFEMLPNLKKRFNARLNEELQGYELVKIYPEIYLDFDYQHGEIICDTLVRIQDREIKGADTLSLPLDLPYWREQDDIKTWYGVDRESLETFIRFLEENEFVISRGRYVIKDEIDQQNFITGGFLHIPEDWHVTRTHSFDELEVIPIELEPIVEISTEGKINWFDFQVRYNLGGESFTHQEILAKMRKNSQGDSYIQIGNKYYVIFNDSKVKVIEDTLNQAKKEDGHYQTEFYNLLYYRTRFHENGIEVQGDKIYNELEEDITGQKLVQQWPIPAEVEPLLRNYQKTGYFWMRFLHKYRLAGILADDMGLGKTVQVLTLIRSVQTNKPTLVVCPKTLLYNWAAEIEKFFPDMRYLIYYGNPTERQELGDKLANYQVIITTYSIVSKDLDWLQDVNFSFCILDEAQQIKNFRTKRAESVKNLEADHRLVLTGTPIENSLDELWSLFDFLMCGYLDSYPAFKRKYITPIKEQNDLKLLHDLKQKISPFLLRRTKQEVLTELPEKTEKVTKVEMTRLQEDVYKTILDQVRDDILNSVREFGFKRSQITVLAALTRLRQVCNHPQLVLQDLDEEVTSGKLEALMEIVGEAIAGGHKMLIFSQFVKMLKLIEEEFKKADIQYEYLDGSTKNRMERVNHFNENPTIPAFLISLKAGGTGLNLTSADIVIHVDPWWKIKLQTVRTALVKRTKF